MLPCDVQKGKKRKALRLALNIKLEDYKKLQIHGAYKKYLSPLLLPSAGGTFLESLRTFMYSASLSEVIPLLIRCGECTETETWAALGRRAR